MCDWPANIGTTMTKNPLVVASIGIEGHQKRMTDYLFFWCFSESLYFPIILMSVSSHCHGWEESSEKCHHEEIFIYLKKRRPSSEHYVIFTVLLLLSDYVSKGTGFESLARRWSSSARHSFCNTVKTYLEALQKFPTLLVRLEKSLLNWRKTF